MLIRSRRLVICLVIACSGCTVVKMQQESSEMSVRVAQKQEELTHLQDRQAALSTESKRLLAEVDAKQVTLNQLDSGLEKLRQENSRLKAETESQRREQQRVEADVKKFQADIAALKSDDRLSDQAKREKIESLKKQLKAYLQLMLTQ